MFLEQLSIAFSVPAKTEPLSPMARWKSPTQKYETLILFLLNILNKKFKIKKMISLSNMTQQNKIIKTKIK